MARITRVAMQIFGSNAASDQMAVFGSLAAGSPQLIGPGSPGAIMALPQYLDGWFASVINGGAPTIEDMNALQYLNSYQLAYILQQGIPEWNSSTTYYTNNFVASNGLLYVSMQDNNLNHAVSSGSYWMAFASGGSSVGVTALNGLQGNVSIAQGSNVTVNTTGSSIIISSVTPGSNFIALDGSNSPTQGINWGSQNLSNVGSLTALNTLAVGTYPLNVGSAYILLSPGTMDLARIQLYAAGSNIAELRWDDAELTILNPGLGLDFASFGLNFFNVYDNDNNATFQKDTNQNIIIGHQAASTADVNGFLYLPAMPGSPTGSPTNISGRVPVTIDGSANKLYFYSSGSWHTPGASAAGVNSFNGLTGSITLAQGSNITISGSGSIITISAAGGGGGGGSGFLALDGSNSPSATIDWGTNDLVNLGDLSLVGSVITLNSASGDDNQWDILVDGSENLTFGTPNDSGEGLINFSPGGQVGIGIVSGTDVILDAAGPSRSRAIAIDTTTTNNLAVYTGSPGTQMGNVGIIYAVGGLTPITSLSVNIDSREAVGGAAYNGLIVTIACDVGITALNLTASVRGFFGASTCTVPPNGCVKFIYYANTSTGITNGWYPWG